MKLARISKLIRTGLFAIRHPVKSLRILNNATPYNSHNPAPQSLLTSRYATTNSPRLQHIAALIRGNAGDVLLPIVLRDLFDSISGVQFQWTETNAHPLFDDRRVRETNAQYGTVIGGGGLFLRDTNSNTNSGWQWNCPIERLREIRTPIVVFAVGYNRFRGQPDFDPVFSEHLSLLAEKSVYIGLRNSGSIEAIKRYLPADLHRALRFQPCMTTMLATLYPKLVERTNQRANEFIIAFNTAFDRPTLRFGTNEVATLGRLCDGLKNAVGDSVVRVVSHCADDAQIMPFMRAAGIECEAVSLVNASPARIVRFYCDVDLVIGMRGHSQMIPFGCGTPIISLISHDKLGWFLDDIDRKQWGIEVRSSDVGDQLKYLIADVRRRPDYYRSDIMAIQSHLWRISQVNVRDAMGRLWPSAMENKCKP